MYELVDDLILLRDVTINDMAQMNTNTTYQQHFIEEIEKDIYNICAHIWLQNSKSNSNSNKYICKKCNLYKKI